MTSDESLGGPEIINQPEIQSVEQNSMDQGYRNRPADIEVPLRTTEVFLPQSPISVNGQPYSIGVNEAKLAEAVNTVAERQGLWLIKYPKVLEIVVGGRSGEILPNWQGFSLQPNDLKSEIYTEKGLKGTVIKLTVPKEVSSEELSEQGAVNFMTNMTNIELMRLINKNFDAKKSSRSGRKLGFVALTGSVGQGVGIALSDTNVERILNGSLGASAGIMLGSSAVVASLMWKSSIGGNEENLGQERYALKRAKLASDKKIRHRFSSTNVLNGEPIIQLESIKSTD